MVDGKMDGQNRPYCCFIIIHAHSPWTDITLIGRSQNSDASFSCRRRMWGASQPLADAKILTALVPEE